VTKQSVNVFDDVLVRCYCEPHGVQAATVVMSRDGIELVSQVSDELIVFSDAAERQRVTGGARRASRDVGTTSTPYDEASELVARGCKDCGPIAIRGPRRRHIRNLADEALRTGKKLKATLPAPR
jgi:hypothetical protein